MIEGMDAPPEIRIVDDPGALAERASGLPAAMVRPTNGRLLWILDRAAAALLAARRTS